MRFLRFQTAYWIVSVVFPSRRDRVAHFGTLLLLELPEVMHMLINHLRRFLTATLRENAEECSTKILSSMESTLRSAILDSFFTSL